jgi:hypothetical protein
MKFEITLTSLENTGPIDQEMRERFQKIFAALIQAGGLTGVKSGKTILHFDKFGDFRGVQLDYWPYEKRN